MTGCSSPVVRLSDHGRHVMSSSPVPLKTRHAGERCTLSLEIDHSRIIILRILVWENEMYTNEEYCEMVLLHGQCNRTGSCHRRIPLSRATPPSLQIPTEDVLGYVLTHPECSVRDISKACSYSNRRCGTYCILYDAYIFRPVLAQD
ncbi:DUF4817 domain-containing protein [Trichonephila clavipes]|uniref:DUF4817 domain-containing protein n=1 Tax=Trichonephila clavipes TaxID=2585209 RepID=A0A8X6RXF1_TRICX|nr:DUF4817 domain-containing protein [Trichonephila clavipes]